MIDLVLISASGFGIKQDDDSHVKEIHRRLRDNYQGVWPQGEIIYRPWDAPWHHLARRIHKAAIPDCPTIFLGHSYGCGWGYKRFEQEWRRKGRQVDLAILIDPVPRAFNLFFIFNLFALTRWGVVRTWARHVLAFRQVNDLPMGRHVVLRSRGKQEITRWVYGSRSNIIKYAPNTPSNEIVHDPAMTHTTIDGDATVQQLTMDRVDLYLSALRAG